MPFVTPADLLAAAQKNQFYAYNVAINNLADAEKYLAAELKKALENRQGCKDNRPWNLVDMGKVIDPNVPWIGFEFETGFDKHQDYKDFVNFLWGHNYVAIDREGTGQYPVEVAFPPQPIAEVLAGESLLVKTLQFVEEKGLKPALNPTTFTRRDVGIHAGISTPKLRKGDYGTAVRRLDKIIQGLTHAEMDELYGRHVLHWGGAHDRHSYVEIKVFRAIPELAHVQKVALVAARMAVLLDYLIDHPNVNKLDNAYKFLAGKVKAPKAA